MHGPMNVKWLKPSPWTDRQTDRQTDRESNSKGNEF